MNEETGTLGNKEAYAYAHPDYVAQLEALKIATEEEERLKYMLSAAQARIALASAGMLEVVKAAVDASSDEALKISWEYGTEWSREDPKLVSLAKTLGMTDSDIDNLFLRAMAVS